jgi:hypothetical protein
MRSVRNKCALLITWNLKIGAFLSGDGCMKTFNVNLEDYMTLFTDMVLSLRMIEQFGNGRNLACFL